MENRPVDLPAFDESVLRAPADEQTIWRYMDLPRLLSLVQRKQLYFASLGSLEDPFEKGTLATMVAVIRTVVESGVFPSVPLSSLDELSAQAQQMNGIYVNCWHLSAEESAAMWQLYSTDKGIAVRTTAKRLRDSFLPNTRKQTLIALVQYVSTEKWIKALIGIIEGSLSSDMVKSCMGLLKRDAFAYEREVRALFVTPGESAGHLGSYLGVDVNILIEKLFISPKAPKWLEEVVRSVLSQYGFPEIPVVRSTLFDSFESHSARMMKDEEFLRKVKEARSG